MNLEYQYSNRKLLRNILYNLFGRVLPLLVGLISIPFLIREMGIERFGILTIIWLIIGYFGIFDLGIGRANTKFVAEYMASSELDEMVGLIWTSLILLFGLGIIGGFMFYLGTPLMAGRLLNIPAALERETLQSFYLVSLAIPITISTAGLSGVLEAHQHFGLINAIKIPASIISYLGPLLILLIWKSLVAVVILLVSLRFMVFFIFLYSLMHTIPESIHFIRPKMVYVKKLLLYGGWLTVSNVVGPLMTYMDRFIVGTFFTMKAVAYYASPYEVITRLQIIPESLMPVLFPVLSAYSVLNFDKINEIHRRAVKYLFLGLVPVVITIIILARPFLNLWLGPEFAQNSTLILQILAVGVLINALAKVPFGAIQAIGKPDMTGKLHLIELPIYLAALWFFIKNCGLTGVALAWLARITFDAVVLFWLAARLIPNINRMRCYKKNCFLSCAMFVMFILFILNLSNIIMQLSLLTIAIMAFAVFTWIYILDDLEKKWVSLCFDKAKEGKLFAKWRS